MMMMCKLETVTGRRLIWSCMEGAMASEMEGTLDMICAVVFVRACLSLCLLTLGGDASQIAHLPFWHLCVEFGCC